jgi:hypothetical protein
MDKETQSNDWLSRVQARRVIGCSEPQVSELAKRGYLTVKRLPGFGRPRYFREDCERLATQIITPATA